LAKVAKVAKVSSVHRDLRNRDHNHGISFFHILKKGPIS
jgi:hypothetical protein